jgi:gluconolactonase
MKARCGMLHPTSRDGAADRREREPARSGPAATGARSAIRCRVRTMVLVLFTGCRASVTGGSFDASDRDAAVLDPVDGAVLVDAGADRDADLDRDTGPDPDGGPDYRGVVPVAESIEWIDADLFDNTCGIDWNARTRELLFTVCQVNDLWRWRPGVSENHGFDVVRRGEGDDLGMFGVAFAPDDSLVVTESSAHRVTRARPPYGAPESIADRWPGSEGTSAGRFNMPAHVVVRRDGTIYFTDPTPAEDELELGFSGIFRIDPGGVLTLEASGGWPREGTRPGGIALSPDQHVLYVSTENISGSQGIYAFPIEEGGALGDRALFVPGDAAGGGARGLCVDAAGNLYHGVYRPDDALLVFSPEGEPIATLDVPFAADCTFGEDDLRTMFVAAHSGADTHNLYRVRLNIPGAPP